MKNILAWVMILAAILPYHGLLASQARHRGRYVRDTKIKSSGIKGIAIFVSGGDPTLAKFLFVQENRSRSHYTSFVLQAMAKNLLDLRWAVQVSLPAKSVDRALAALDDADERLQGVIMTHKIGMLTQSLHKSVTDEQKLAMQAEQDAWELELAGLDQR